MSQNTKDRLWMWLAWHLPKELAKWAAVRVMANATQGQYGNQLVLELRAMDALRRWG
jgi:hypothetical protein